MNENGRGVMARAAELFEQGLSVRKVAAELGVSKSQAHRLRAKLYSANTPTESVPPPSAGTVGQRSSSGDTARESRKPADQGAPAGEQEARITNEAKCGTPSAGSDTSINPASHPSGTAPPSRPRYIPWQHDARTGLWWRPWPEDLD